MRKEYAEIWSDCKIRTANLEEARQRYGRVIKERYGFDPVVSIDELELFCR